MYQNACKLLSLCCNDRPHQQARHRSAGLLNAARDAVRDALRTFRCRCHIRGFGLRAVHVPRHRAGNAERLIGCCAWACGMWDLRTSEPRTL